MSKDLPMLVAAEASNVLDQYNHSVTLRDGFAIVYGPNGVGKTKFLEIIRRATDIDGRALSQLPFEEVLLTYSDASNLRVTRETLAVERPVPGTYIPANIKFEYTHSGGRTDIWEFIEDGFHDWVRSRTRFEESPDGSWVDLSDGTIVSAEEMLDMYARRPGSRRKEPDPLPEAIQNFRDRSAAFLIKAQRLEVVEPSIDRDAPWRGSGRPRRRTASRISKQSEIIRGLLNDAQTEHSKISQKLDRTFPHRVLEVDLKARALDSEAVRERFAEQDELRSRVGRVASVSMNEEFPLTKESLDTWELHLLDLYIDDAMEKLEAFNPLLEKIELLQSILNARLLNKDLLVTEEGGLRVFRNRTDEPISLNLLSSGEQHEIILMIDLLFNVEEGATVLIDEPEISLHVAWQIAFIPDVRRIAELAKFNFVVATHSPQIINDEWGHATRLGPVEAGFE